MTTTLFLISNAFFQLSITVAQYFTEISLKCCLLHIDIIVPRHIFSILVSMPPFWSIYVFFMWSMFHYHFYYNIMYSHSVCLLYVINFSLSFSFSLQLSRSLIKTDTLVRLDILIKISTSGCFWALAKFSANFSLVLLIKVLLIKKVYYYKK